MSRTTQSTEDIYSAKKQALLRQIWRSKALISHGENNFLFLFLKSSYIGVNFFVLESTWKNWTKKIGNVLKNVIYTMSEKIF